MRQQLDELDSLLQRMLSLPVNQLDEAGEVVLPAPQPAAAASYAIRQTPPAAERTSEPTYFLSPETREQKAISQAEKPAAPNVRMEPPARLRGPLVVYQPMSAPDMLVAAPPVEAQPHPEPASVRSTPVDTKDWGPAVEVEPPVPEPPPIESLPPLPVARSPFLERHQARFQKRRETIKPLRPVGWFSGLLDRVAVTLGGPFLWLIQPETRSLLGWIGIALLVAALAILAGDWCGWCWPT
jgi:hypothetical protein